MSAHLHALLHIRADERVAHHVRLERVQPWSWWRLERDALRPHLAWADVRKLMWRDKDAVELVIAHEEVPRRLAVLERHQCLGLAPRR